MRIDRIFAKVNATQLAEMLLAGSNTGVGRSGDVLVRFIKQSFTKTSMRVPSPPGSPPGTVTNRLRNSIQATVPQNGRIIVGTNERYARKQEEGGVIRAKKTYLTVPANFEAAEIRANVKTLRSVPDLDFRPGPNRGVAFLFRNGKLMYVLKRSVRLPPRPYFRPAANNQTVQDKMRQAFKAGFVREVRRYFKNMTEIGAPVG